MVNVWLKITILGPVPGPDSQEARPRLLHAKRRRPQASIFFLEVSSNHRSKSGADLLRTPAGHGSLVAKTFNGIELGSLPRRVVAKENSNTCRK